MNAGREKVRVARALGTLPKLSEAFRKGEVSYSKVRAITRVATPENEEYLLMIARHGTAHHVETLVRGYRRACRLNDAGLAEGQYASREFNYHWDDDGSLVFNGRLPAEVGAMLMKALQSAIDHRQCEEQPRFARCRLRDEAAAGAPSEAKGSRRSAPRALSFSRHEIQDGPHVTAVTREPMDRNLAVDLLYDMDHPPFGELWN